MLLLLLSELLLNAIFDVYLLLLDLVLANNVLLDKDPSVCLMLFF